MQEKAGLVVDPNRDLAQFVLVLPGMVAAEKQFGSVGQFHPDVRLCSAAIASIGGGKCRWLHRHGHDGLPSEQQMLLRV